jgi:hypothetical protein
MVVSAITNMHDKLQKSVFFFLRLPVIIKTLGQVLLSNREVMSLLLNKNSIDVC